jgi:diguanylate cyclase (GGDEF)-like protein/PAS domain S-box-containing protein
MKLLLKQTDSAHHLYRLILDNALDSFIAIDDQGLIIEWSLQAEKTFGWTREEVLGTPLTHTVIPERYHAAHMAGLKRYLRSREGKILHRTIELYARRKDGTEIPVELTVTPIEPADTGAAGGSTIFSASLRDISRSKGLEEVVQHQANITKSILASMADAVVVADLGERLILVNPAAQRLLGLKPADDEGEQSFHAYTLFGADRSTRLPERDRPMARALRGEKVDGMIAFVRNGDLADGAWVSANARPLIDYGGALIGGVVVFRDITELREREEAVARQAKMLQEQASLLDLAHDAILVRAPDDVITYWNSSAVRLYQYSRDEALGRVSHELLSTRFPVPLEQIEAIVREKHYWEGELIHTTKDGREITVFSQWALEFHEGRPSRYLETNADITQRVQTEKALRLAQENYRLLVESSTDYAMMVMDPAGTILSWSPGAEKILGLAPQEAIGQPISALFTTEDRIMGEPLRELEEAKRHGRSENNRWHVRKDGGRFWAEGVVTPLWNADGSLRGYVKVLRDHTQQRLEEEQTQFLANHDMLTGLPNRVSFSNELHQFIAASQRTQLPFSVLLLDLDRFKYVNDTFGHHTGDLLLKEVGMRILSTLRETDFVARLGGDEFVVIQSPGPQPASAESLAHRLVEALGRTYRFDGNQVISGTSVGISLYPKDANNSVELLEKADLALYRAKSLGRGRFQLYTSDLSAESASKKGREHALRDALEKHQFELYYQPQIDLNSWKITTVEALLRWQATDLEMVLPAEFLAVAEETGMIVEIGEWALREACRQVHRWQEMGLSGLRLSVNCSARQFSDPGFTANIPPILLETGFAADCLELEFSESMLAQHPEVKQHLHALRQLGVRITVDNFGTGTIPLIDLKDLEIDVLKIDKQFIQHLPHRREDSAITSAIITLAHDLGIGVAAGGVETAEQLAYLKARDCMNVQGFIFSPPIPAEEFEQLMMSGHWSRINRLPELGEPGGGKDLH